MSATEEPPVETERRVRLFNPIKPSGSHGIWSCPGREALLRREGRRLILEPIARPSLLGVLATLKPLDEDVPDIEALPAETVDL
jgi:antitoxin VapB